MKVIQLFVGVMALVLSQTMLFTLWHFAKYGYTPVLDGGRWMVPLGVEPNMVVFGIDMGILALTAILSTTVICHIIEEIRKCR